MTVISTFNIEHFSEIEDYVHSVGMQSYRNEIAEQRTEFFNLTEPITPETFKKDGVITEQALPDVSEIVDEVVGYL